MHNKTLQLTLDPAAATAVAFAAPASSAAELRRYASRHRLIALLILFATSVQANAQNAVEDALYDNSDEIANSEPAVDAPETSEDNTDSKVANSRGFVVVEFTVGLDGSLSEFQVLESSPSGVFDSAAIEALGKWKFEPSETVRRQSVTFDFEYKSPEAQE
ncbi:MAG: energy transducer TonB [Pseudomonadota bacterium]